LREASKYVGLGLRKLRVTPKDFRETPKDLGEASKSFGLTLKNPTQASREASGLDRCNPNGAAGILAGSSFPSTFVPD
jgi:hypothetical protein